MSSRRAKVRSRRSDVIPEVVKSENLNDDDDLTAWQRECTLTYDDLVKAGIYLPTAKDGLWQFSEEYMRLDEPEQIRRLQQVIKSLN